MSEQDGTQTSLIDWRNEYYEGTGTISTIIRNLALAGIGIIWIFRNTDLSHDKILPPELITPIKFIIGGLIFDLTQYLWRTIAIFIIFRKYDNLLVKKQITPKKASDITIPLFIENIGWIFFLAKIILVVIGYCFIWKFINAKF